MSVVTTHLLDGFNDPRVGRDRWDALLEANDVDVVYLTWQFQRVWWETFQRGSLLLIAAERGGRLIAVAPFYTESGMVYFVGSEFESDCLDFIGDISDPSVLDALLRTAREAVSGFVGFHFYFVPDRWHTGERLAAAAARLGLRLYEEDKMLAPVLDLAGCPAAARAAADKDSMRRAERFFRRTGTLEVRHFRDGSEILPQLGAFFDQHAGRWAATSNPSRFENPKARLLLERFARQAADTGWLRFSRADWDGRPIAYQYGFCYRGRYLWGLASFAADLAKHSPGQVLLRHVLMGAIDEGARTFDFGTGDQAYKRRFATEMRSVRTWEMYPTSRRASHAPGAIAADRVASREH